MRLPYVVLLLMVVWVAGVSVGRLDAKYGYAAGLAAGQWLRGIFN